MALADTENTSLLFVTRSPAWERGVRLKQQMGGTQFTSRAGLEQRVARQRRATWSVQFAAVLDQTDAAARLVRAAAEMRAPLVLPFWAIPGVTVSTISADKVTLNRFTTPDFYAAGDYVYFWTDALGGQFRLVTGNGASLQEMTLAPLTGALAYPIGTSVYPCRIFIRSGDARTTMMSESSVEETLNFASL